MQEAMEMSTTFCIQDRVTRHISMSRAETAGQSVSIRRSKAFTGSTAPLPCWQINGTWSQAACTLETCYMLAYFARKPRLPTFKQGMHRSTMQAWQHCSKPQTTI